MDHGASAADNAPMLEDSAPVTNSGINDGKGGRCLRTRIPIILGDAEATPKSSAQLSLSRNGYGQSD